MKRFRILESLIPHNISAKTISSAANIISTELRKRPVECDRTSEDVQEITAYQPVGNYQYVYHTIMLVSTVDGETGNRKLLGFLPCLTYF